MGLELCYPNFFFARGLLLPSNSGVPRNFVRGVGGSTNSVEDRENSDLGAVAP